MTYVVCEPCVQCKHGDCVDACPVDCFYQDEEMLYINPEECIDCDACARFCPVDAIFIDSEVPEKWQSYIKINADFQFTEESRVLEAKDVVPGPKLDSQKAEENEETHLPYKILLEEKNKAGAS
ncbi:4Fe-4S dicluster domain-containing protein [Kordiimonas laminariae]|uniref:4Fe-4S dicluster domain-containing protein n=1 Tax=Kordiimonas laminariae TaxID=2917717 RepID=UPI001FF4BD37|nr:ferredoxin family protein [Kordiimonas laminariae]MCK0069479.1 ferredoxin family protein [Kordiimonas laminariae]